MIFALTKGQILRYVFLPGVVPRLKEFFSQGFSTLAYYLALVYRAVQILPENHPYIMRSNIARFGVLDVFREASKHLVFDKNNIDKVVIFFALIAGIMMLAFQFLFLMAAIMVNPSMAQSAINPTLPGNFFVTPNPDTDIAFRLLDRVFGIPGIFNSNDMGTTSFHSGLHILFQFYSTGILVVAGVILAYFIFVVLAETAQTGTPFGKRFNHVWAPIRLVVGIGLLIPVSYGMNSAQWITLQAAKFGSGFATNGWVTFNTSLADNYIDAADTVVTPNIPRLRELATFMMMTKACRFAYESPNIDIGVDLDIQAYIVKNTDGGPRLDFSATSYDDALTFSGNDAISIVFGMYSPEFISHPSSVYPYCGELKLDVTSINNDGARIINKAYYDMLLQMWITGYTQLQWWGTSFVKKQFGIVAPSPPPNYRETLIAKMETDMRDLGITPGVTAQQAEVAANTDYATQGWAGAGIWYNQIAQINGALISAANNVPAIKAYPAAMEFVRMRRLQESQSIDPTDQFLASVANGTPIQLPAISDQTLVVALNDVYTYWNEGEDIATGNIFIDIINVLLGTQGLFDMCANADIHPMAQISALGKGLIEAAIRNIIGGLGLGGAGLVAGAMAPFVGPALSAASSFLFTIASIGLLIGFIMFYLVPFLPFLYFFFAVGGWIKGLFEAMVGLPLWALAHLRIDGQGLPGDAAMNGYYLIFEVFIRPILIVFGLLAAVSVFGAMVKVLNEIYSIAVSNLAGHEGSGVTGCVGMGNSLSSAPMGSAEWMRGPVDEFFFTIMYAILVYMIGMSTFKLIDRIPNDIMRWTGHAVQTFDDFNGETAEGLMQKVAVGGSLISGQVQGALGQGAQAIGAGAQGFAGLFRGQR